MVRWRKSDARQCPYCTLKMHCKAHRDGRGLRGAAKKETLNQLYDELIQSRLDRMQPQVNGGGSGSGGLLPSGGAAGGSYWQRQLEKQRLHDEMATMATMGAVTGNNADRHRRRPKKKDRGADGKGTIGVGGRNDDDEDVKRGRRKRRRKGDHDFAVSSDDDDGASDRGSRRKRQRRRRRRSSSSDSTSSSSPFSGLSDDDADEGHVGHRRRDLRRRDVGKTSRRGRPGENDAVFGGGGGSKEGETDEAGRGKQRFSANDTERSKNARREDDRREARRRGHRRRGDRRGSQGSRENSEDKFSASSSSSSSRGDSSSSNDDDTGSDDSDGSCRRGRSSRGRRRRRREKGGRRRSRDERRGRDERRKGRSKSTRKDRHDDDDYHYEEEGDPRRQELEKARETRRGGGNRNEGASGRNGLSRDNVDTDGGLRGGRRSKTNLTKGSDRNDWSDGEAAGVNGDAQNLKKSRRTSKRRRTSRSSSSSSLTSDDRCRRQDDRHVRHDVLDGARKPRDRDINGYDNKSYEADEATRRSTSRRDGMINGHDDGGRRDEDGRRGRREEGEVCDDDQRDVGVDGGRAENAHDNR